MPTAPNLYTAPSLLGGISRHEAGRLLPGWPPMLFWTKAPRLGPVLRPAPITHTHPFAWFIAADAGSSSARGPE
jgi:hypothetical protein